MFLRDCLTFYALHVSNNLEKTRENASAAFHSEHKQKQVQANDNKNKIYDKSGLLRAGMREKTDIK